jgi:hypothetical protein
MYWFIKLNVDVVKCQWNVPSWQFYCFAVNTFTSLLDYALGRVLFVIWVPLLYTEHQFSCGITWLNLSFLTFICYLWLYCTPQTKFRGVYRSEFVCLSVSLSVRIYFPLSNYPLPEAEGYCFGVVRPSFRPAVPPALLCREPYLGSALADFIETWYKYIYG